MKRGRIAASVAVAALIVAALGSTARADDRAQADRLFEEGKALVERGHYAEACRDFEASAAVDPGIGTRLWLADCYESLGRYASARLVFQTVAADAQRAHDKRAAVADERARALDRRVAFYVVRAGGSVPGEIVECDGTPFRPADGPLAVDPGRHVLVAHAPAHDVWETSFTAAAGTTSDIGIPALRAQLEVTPARPEATPARPVPAVEPPRWKTWAFVSGGAGVAALVASGVLTGLAVHDHDDSMHLGCTPSQCSQIAHDDEDRARSEGNAATGTVVTGAVLVAAGITMYILAPSTRTPVATTAGSFAVRF